jgi:hypothetical protein
MSGQHRATPKQWEVVEICREEGKIPWPTATALLELRARVEALEAAQQDKLDRLIALDAADPTPDPAMTEPRPASAEAQPAGGLAERVAQGIAAADDEGLTNMTWNYHARAAIREVAAAAKERIAPFNPWLRWNDVAQWLEQKASQ